MTLSCLQARRPLKCIYGKPSKVEKKKIISNIDDITAAKLTSVHFLFVSLWKKKINKKIKNPKSAVAFFSGNLTSCLSPSSGPALLPGFRWMNGDIPRVVYISGGKK